AGGGPRQGAGGGAGRAAVARRGASGRGRVHVRGGRRGHAPARARVHARVLHGTRAPGAGSRLRVSDPTGRVFDALADPNRRYVLEALASSETATATALAAELPETREAVCNQTDATTTVRPGV